MLGSMMESMGGMFGHVAETPTPTATAAAYARALEGATESTKASIAKLYPVRKGSSAHRHEVKDDTRDQPADYIEKYIEEIDRDGIAQLHTIPVDKIAQQEENQEENESIRFDPEVEAKNLWNSILHLDTEVTEAAAAVYHFFQTKTVDEEISPGDRASQVIQFIKDQLRRGNSKPAYQFLETAKSVLPILLEEREEAGLELEANMFSKDSASHSAELPADDHGQYDDVRSITEQSAAIFQILEDTQSFGTVERLRQSEDPVGTSYTGDSNSNIFRILEEKEETPESTPDGIYSTDFDPSNFNAPNLDDMDLEFVEHFDLAYSEFLYSHPTLVAQNPELLKKLRIYKLQKLLEYNEVLERTNLGKLHAMEEEKRVTEESMQEQLKDAVSKKAARQVFLQAEFNDINWNTKLVQAKLRWKLFKYSEDRAKRQSKLREQFKLIPQAKTRQDLINLIPEGPHTQKLQTAIKASFIAEGSPQPHGLSSKQESQLRNIQVENSVINSEILMLKQKLAHLRKETTKLEWVQSTLMELNPVAVKKFKKKFQKNEGVKL